MSAPKKDPLARFYDSAKDALIKLRRADFVEWQEAITALEKEGMARRDAILQASENYKCLETPLDALYDEEEAVERERIEAEDGVSGGIKVGKKRQPYIQNVRWAVNAAGKARLSKVLPKQCPNYLSWYLYEQAMEDPAKFTALLNAVETKQKEDKDEFREQVKRDSDKSIKQIDQLLAEIAGTP